MGHLTFIIRKATLIILILLTIITEIFFFSLNWKLGLLDLIILFIIIARGIELFKINIWAVALTGIIGTQLTSMILRFPVNFGDLIISYFGSVIHIYIWCWALKSKNNLLPQKGN